ncbi:MAG: hypothetical protein GX107_04155 [Clostridiales bacterium]|jgi:hypothetical protein|nr:hypothetical protein [Clostridiales bacterium]
MKKTYYDKVHLWGRISSVTALFVMLSVPLFICLRYDAWPPIQGVIKGLAAVLPLYWATAVIEVVCYAPMLGAGGMYLSFVTGNISNLKLPCALSAMESSKVKPNTEEGEIITTIAVATSAIVTTIIIAAGVVLFTPILPCITEKDSVFAPAFQQVLPALFGAIGAGYFVKHWKISVLPIIIGIVILLAAPSTAVGLLIPFTVVVSLAGAHIMYKKGIL